MHNATWMEVGDIHMRERLANAEQKVQVLMDASDADVKADSTAAPATAFLDD